MNSSFDTVAYWTLDMKVMAYPGGNEALEKANKRLLYLSQVTGPFADGKGGWLCEYSGASPDNDENSNTAYTLSPAKN